jgi:hypothetical protein
MADTGKKHYSKEESINRILRVLIGSPAPNDAPGTLAGSVISIDEAISKLAEVLEGNDAEEQFYLPDTAAVENLTVDQLYTEDIDVNDTVSANVLDASRIEIGTGTFYAGFGRVSVGGISDPDSHGNGGIVLTFGQASPLPTGTLDHLGGVLFADGGALKWLGASGTVTTLAGS